MGKAQEMMGKFKFEFEFWIGILIDLGLKFYFENMHVQQINCKYEIFNLK